MINTAQLHYPRIDPDLARRLERAEALACVAYVEARQSLQPSVGAAWAELGGTHALFDGVTSPLTQSFGLGMFLAPSPETLAALEAFFAARSVPTAHEVSSFAAPITWQELSARGYSPIETSTVLIRPTAHPPTPPAERVRARRVGPEETTTWSRVMIEGLGSESAELVDAVRDLIPVMAQSQGAHCFLAELEGEPISAGILSVQNGVAVLGGASTIPAARRQGGQAALLQARLDYAADLGVELAMLVAGPGSGSQRNAERQGFRPAYLRSKWRLVHSNGSVERS